MLLCREWVVRHFNLWESEIEFSNTMIKDDDRNNAAWNYRYFILTQKPNHDIDSKLKDEIE